MPAANVACEVSFRLLRLPEAQSHSCPFVPGETVDALASCKERALFGADRKMWRRNAMEDACPIRRSGWSFAFREPGWRC